jgi:hypothetical protein
MSSLLMTLPADRVGMNIGVGAQGETDLAEPLTQVNRSRVTLSCSMRGLL